MEAVSAKHSPGPWRWSDKNMGDLLDADDSHVLARASDDETYIVPDRPDAALIAAAPELLEALRAVVKEAGRSTASFMAAEALIKRVEGT